jgi:hypothetical protein
MKVVPTTLGSYPSIAWAQQKKPLQGSGFSHQAAP